VAVDGAGNVYVADNGNSAIRRVTASGAVTTLAGNGANGSGDGTGAAASFYGPTGVALDASGNLYVADNGNNKIRKIAPNGVVTTLAGSASGAPGSVDGQGTAAAFRGPYGIAVDGSGNVIVGDAGNNKIRKVTPAGAVTTIAGSGTAGSLDGTGTGATFNFPTGIAVDGAGNIFVVDTSNRKIRKVAPDGSVTTVAGSGGYGSTDGPGTTASFYFPFGVAVDGAGNLFVSDAMNNNIRKVAPGGVVSTLAGSGARASRDGTGTGAAFSYPIGVAADASGNVYVADFATSKLRRITAAAVVTTLAGSGDSGKSDGAGPVATFQNPTGVAANGADEVYVADSLNHSIRKVSAGGDVSTFAGTGANGGEDGTGTAASFSFPTGVAVDGAGSVYVAENWGNRIRKATSSGVVTTLAGSGNSESVDGSGTGASFNAPTGLAVDGALNVYVADTGGNKIRKVTPAGVVTTLAGSGSPGGADGTGSAASFDTPTGIAVDSAGIVYVVDANNRVRKVASGGVVTTFAGSGSSSSVDGTGTAASFSYPYGLAADSSGNLWVVEWNGKIRKVTSGGVVTTVAGSGKMGSSDGTGAAAAFAYPQGIAANASGKVYVADTYNNAIRLGRNMGSATCAPDDVNLCLLEGRFRLSASYTDYGGGHGTGKAVYLTPDTGYFWFFDAANVEAVAKMVSFCGGGSNNVALYAGGLTDLGVTLNVTDTRNGTKKDYTNPLGTGFTLLRDGPFGCPAGVTAGAAQKPAAEKAPADPVVETSSWTDFGPATSGACTADPATLCLLNGRFQVRAAYQDYSGHTGTGHAVPLTSDTGHFWFFGSSNVETVVKMVSFCGSGSNNVGVYAGGLTDLQVTLTVTDMLSGLVKTYTNPLGTPFQLVRDGPFSCP
jgi:sugar lactone lactonase YvrE